MKIKELDNRMDEWLLTHCPPVGRASVWVNQNKIVVTVLLAAFALAVWFLATAIAKWRGL